MRYKDNGGLKLPSAPLEKDFLTGPAQAVGERSSLTGFTIMELIVVVIIISVIAAFVIPNYQMSLEKAHEKDAMISLRAMTAANQVYNINNGSYWPTDFPTFHPIADINSTLNLNITPSSVEYFCLGNALGYVCGANYPNSASTQWSINSSSGWNSGKPYCNISPCPTCLNQAGGGC